MEDLKTIAESISQHTYDEHVKNVENRSIGRFRILMISDNSNKLVWLTNRECRQSSSLLVNISGNVTGTAVSGKIDTLREPKDSVCVSKNSCYGLILASHTEGKFTVKVSGKDITFEICNSSKYLNNRGSAEDISIHILGYQKQYFKTIAEIHNILEKREEKIEELASIEKLIVDQKAKIEEQIQNNNSALHNGNLSINQELEDLESQQRQHEKELLILDEQYKNATNFIRRQAELRRLPLLDAKQIQLKFSNIYTDTTLIIDGGPGTGKTTTLIQRIKFLVDQFALEDFADNNRILSLSDDQKKVIFDVNQDWIFFSPTELLRLYLKSNMSHEGLRDVEEKTHVWAAYLKKIARDEYKLAGDGVPFRFSKKTMTTEPLLIHDQKALIDRFKNYYLAFFNKRIEDLTKLDISGYPWKIIADIIKKQCERYLLSPSLDKLIRLLQNLKELTTQKKVNDENDILLILKTYKSEIKDISYAVHSSSKYNAELYESLKSIIEEWERNKKNLDTSSDEEVEEDEIEEDETITGENIELSIHRRIRKIVIALAKKEGGAKVKLDAIHLKVYELIKDLVPENRIKSLAKLAYFVKYFNPVLKGVDLILFTPLSRIYKLFRTESLKGESIYFNQKLLGLILKEYKNQILHPDELSLLIGFINNLIHSIYQLSKQTFNDMKHKYVLAYKKLCHPVIGVDEATDYSVMDYYAIHSLRHYLISSLTLAGDKMQCLMSQGIVDWNTLSFLFPKLDIQELTTSYRQSSKLLELAYDLHQRVVGVTPNYTCFISEQKNVPSPIYISGDNEQEKADWIIERILEVQKAYGFLPSIAVFLNNASDIAQFKERMEETGVLEDCGIEVKDCSSGDLLTGNDTVRLFPISKVKGLEFEVVFFHNLDALIKEHSEQLLFRYLYVGLSRATFFMGITLTDDDNPHLKEILHSFEKNSWMNVLSTDL